MIRKIELLELISELRDEVFFLRKDLEILEERLVQAEIKITKLTSKTKKK